MTTTRTATLAGTILGSAGLLLAGTGPAPAHDAWSEPAAQHGRSGTSVVEIADRGESLPWYCPGSRTGSNRNGPPPGLTIGQYINRLDFACG